MFVLGFNVTETCDYLHWNEKEIKNFSNVVQVHKVSQEGWVFALSS